MSHANSADAQRTACFDFHRDALEFANETNWRYSRDESTGKQVTEWRDPKPEFTLRCFGLTRVAKQFFLHARFSESGTRPDAERCEALAREVLDRNSRARRRSDNPVEIPGFAGLREFSAANEAALKRLCGGAWRSYFQRGNWRMVFPFTRRNQEREAEALQASLDAGIPQALHVFQFPALGVNHAVLAYDHSESADGIEFLAYDPNTPDEPLKLLFERKSRGFTMPPTHYFIGGPVNAYTVFSGALF